MASGLALRSEGKRRLRNPGTRARDLIGESLGSTAHGSHRLNSRHVQALETLYETSPAIGAARQILIGQLMGGGIAVRRGEKEVEFTPEFRNFFDETWTKFATRSIDSFLKFGYVVFVLEEDRTSLTAYRAAGEARRVAAAEAAAASSRRGKQKAPSKVDQPQNLIPVVPPTETYEVAYEQTGRLGYSRQYTVYSTAPGAATKPDEQAFVVVRDDPDSSGNCTSPTGRCSTWPAL